MSNQVKFTLELLERKGRGGIQVLKLMFLICQGDRGKQMGRTANSHHQVFNEFLRSDQITGLILVSHPYYLPFDNNPLNIKILAYTPFKKILKEGKSEGQHLLKMLESFSVERPQPFKSPFIEIGTY